MNRWIAITAGALCVGLGGGFGLGRLTSPEKRTTGADETSVAKVQRGGQPLASRSARSPGRAGRSFQEILREPGQTARVQSLIDLFAGMDPAQLELEADKLDALPLGDRILTSILLFSRWGEVDPTGAMAHADSMGFTGRFVKPTVLRSWASVDPVNAAQHYLENPGDFAGMGRGRGPQDGGPDIIAREWAKVDPDAAMEWAESLSGSARDGAVVSVIGEVAGSDPAAAVTMAGSLAGAARARALGEIAEQWARSDLAAADAWVATLEPDVRDRALGELLEVQALADPQAAAARLDGIAGQRERDAALERVAGNWAQSDPRAAAEWLTGRDSGAAGDAMRRVMGNWATQDAPGARSFIESQPAGELRDDATQAYLWMDRSLPPAEAMAMAESIADEGSRNRMVGRTARRWLEEDEAAARAFLQSSSSLDDSLKSRLLESAGEER